MASMQSDGNFYRHRKIIVWGIAGLLLLIGVAILVSVLLRVLLGPPAGYVWMPFFVPFGFFFLFLLFLLFRPWSWGWWGWRGYSTYWGSHDEPAEILRRRYARGDISKEQFDQMLRDIARSRSPPS